MRPEQAARTLAILGAIFLIVAALVRLMAAYILTVDERFISGISIQGADRQPLMGLYKLSPDRRQVSFSRGVTVPTEDEERVIWVGNVYSIDLESGEIQSGAPDHSMEYYDVRDQTLVILNDRMRRLLEGRRMLAFAVSDGGQNLAFVEPSNASSNWALYSARGIQDPQLLAQGSYFADLSWSPDGRDLLYVAPVKAVDEVFRFNFDTREPEQLTSDGRRKREPVFSTGGERIAYLAPVEELEASTIGRFTPTPLTIPPLHAYEDFQAAAAGQTEVFVMDRDGANPTRLTTNDLEEFGLGWTEDGQILFSAWRAEWPMVSWLYAVETEGQAEQRVYPSIAIDSLSCRPDLMGANRASVKVAVSNAGKQPQGFPLEISMDRAPLDVITGRSQYRVHREDLSLDPGESRELEFSVPVVDDQKAFLAATIESGVEFPVAAAFCEVEPRTFLLPRLRWFGITLGLVFFGFLFSIPWLRHQKNAWLWRAWFLFLVFLILLVGLESAVILGWLG